MTATLEVDEMPLGFKLVYKKYLDDLDEVLWGRVTGCIVKERGHSQELAERILNQTIPFLLLCGRNPGVGYSPSELVDHGWHALMQYQKPLEDFLLTHCGRMVYHNPHDDPRVDYSSRPRVNTVQALRDHGFVVDEALWQMKAGACGDDVTGACEGYCTNTACSA